MKKTITIGVIVILVLTFIPFISAEESETLQLPIREINHIHEKPMEKVIVTQSGSNLKEDLDKYDKIVMTIPTYRLPYRWFRLDGERYYITVTKENNVKIFDSSKKITKLDNLNFKVEKTNFLFMRRIEITKN